MPSIKLWSQARAARTARTELEAALARPGRARLNVELIHCALLPDLPDRQPLIRRGLLNLHNTDPAKDAFECLQVDSTLYLLGNSPRGLLQAVYALEEKLTFAPNLPPDWHETGAFHLAQRHFHPRFDKWPGQRADIRYLSRLGASHCLICHDWQGSLRNLHGYVASPIFPQAVSAAEIAANRAGLRQLIDACADYALELAIWLTELPCQGGPWIPEPARQEWLERFPPEALSESGTYQGKVLCFAHPHVQEFYRQALHHFFADFPEIDTIFLFGMDSGGEGCDPQSCPRCHGMSKFEQRDRLLRFLVDTGGAIRPGLRVLTTGWHWESRPAEFLDRQARLPTASGVYLAAESDGWQAERQNHAFLRQARATCRPQGQLFLGYDNFHLGDDATHLWGLDLQDFPLGIGAKLARWHDLEADGVFDHWGTYSEMIPSNSMACRAFFVNPLADPETVCHRLARNQYGPAAGEPAFRAWQAIERAHRILSNCATWAPRQWPGWYRGRRLAPLPATFLAETGHDDQPLVAKAALGFTYNGGSLADRLEAVGEGWRLATPHLEEAGKQLAAALAVADDTAVGYGFWWNGTPAPPSRREHLLRHQIYVDFTRLVGQEIGLHFALHACFERLGRNPEAYLAANRDQLRADHDACLNIVAFCDRLLHEQPQTPSHLHAWQADYADKAKTIHQALSNPDTPTGQRRSCQPPCRDTASHRRDNCAPST